MIHPTAIIHPKAQVDPSATVGPYVVIDEGVSLGPECRVGPHVYLTGQTTIGAGNRFHAGCVIGDAPQDVKYKDAPTRVEIGGHNLFREGVTVHRSATPEHATRIGSHNFLMVNSHVGHDATVGNHVIIANGALLGGRAEVGDRVFISGNCLVHQFTRIGTLAIMQGGSGVSQDVPPFTMTRDINTLAGLNNVGLRRANLPMRERLELKRLYHKLFLSGQNLSTLLEEARKEFHSVSALIMIDFVASSRRGVCRHRGKFGDKTRGPSESD